MLKILCIIPARSGSKGIIDKNIKDFKGKPLIAWSIEQAKKSKYYDNMRLIVSTDSEIYSEIAKSYGAEVPFLRPSEISDDLSIDYEFIKHCIDTLYIIDNYKSDIILQLRPTQPLRSVKDIDNCIDIFIKKRQSYDSLRTVVPIEKSAYKMYTLDSNNNILKPLFNEVNGIFEPFNQCRQILPQCYLHNGYIDILNTDIVKKGTISGDKIYPLIMKDNNIDIDTIDDWNKASIMHF